MFGKNTALWLINLVYTNTCLPLPRNPGSTTSQLKSWLSVIVLRKDRKIMMVIQCILKYGLVHQLHHKRIVYDQYMLNNSYVY